MPGPGFGQPDLAGGHPVPIPTAQGLLRRGLFPAGPGRRRLRPCRRQRCRGRGLRRRHGTHPLEGYRRRGGLLFARARFHRRSAPDHLLHPERRRLHRSGHGTSGLPSSLAVAKPGFGQCGHAPHRRGSDLRVGQLQHRRPAAGCRRRVAQKIWTSNDALSNHYATSVYRDGYLYGFHGRQEYGPSLRCVEWRTGRVEWNQDGLRAGTVTLAGDRLLILTERGELILAAANPEGFQVISRAQVLEGTVRAYPALARGRLYARTETALVCIDLRK